MVETAFVTHFPIPPIYPYLPFTPGYLIYTIDIPTHLHVPHKLTYWAIPVKPTPPMDDKVAILLIYALTDTNFSLYPWTDTDLQSFTKYTEIYKGLRKISYLLA